MKSSFCLQNLGLTALLLLAGWTFSTAFAQGEWKTLQPMPTARSYFAGAELDGKIYFFGGSLDPSISTDVVEMYDISAGTWTTKHKLPEKMCCMAAASLGGKIYLVGGAATFWDFPWTKVYAYDPALDTFVAVQNLPAARAFHNVVVLDSEIYAIGGLDVTGEVTGSMVKFNPANSEGWGNMMGLLTPRFLSSAEVVEGQIYVTGGAVSPTTPYGILKTTEVFDPLAGGWYELDAELESGRFMHGSGVVNGNLYVFGGIFSTAELASVERLEVAAGEDSWSFDTSMPTGRRVFASVEANGKIYAAGGINQSVLQNKLEVFDPMISAVEERKRMEPLLKNFPNPFSGRTTIVFQLDQMTDVQLSIYDLYGRPIRILVDEKQVPGEYTIVFDGNDLPKGIYLSRLELKGVKESWMKMVLQ